MRRRDTGRGRPPASPRESSEQTSREGGGPAHACTSALRPPEPGGNELLMLKPFNLWYFVPVSPRKPQYRVRPSYSDIQVLTNE